MFNSNIMMYLYENEAHIVFQKNLKIYNIRILVLLTNHKYINFLNIIYDEVMKCKK